MSRLEVVELRKSYGSVCVVDGVSFTVASGEIFGLLGPNGAGKTTTMSMIAGLLEADSGEVRFDDRPIKSFTKQDRRFLGIAPQDLAIYPELSARENLEFFGKLYGLCGMELKKRCGEVLDQIGLSEHADRDSGHFSGGMKRRLNFGVALIHRPQLLILDEPTVGVDPQSRSYLLDCVRHEASRGMAVIYASHYMEEVSAICDRVAIMDHGRRVAMGSLSELLGQMQQELALRVRRLSDNARERLGNLIESNGSPSGEESRLVLHRSAGAAKTDGLISELRRVLEILDSEETELVSVETSQSSLERLFLELTGHSLRD
ncbi:MAG: ABC transporter ATP-binding protein [Planctomycetota bacterium]|nr:MAG: ABC transporter ATP-binding protein [Planctomycetota bacterium]GDY09499.1 putative ABC transporter ATP-binding protein YfiL [Planctomycetia bacterium]